MALLKDTKPELYTPEAKERKKEMFVEIYSLSFLYRMHLKHCPGGSGGCEPCKKVACLINIFLEEELKTGGKTDFEKLKKGFKLEDLILGDKFQLPSGW